MQNEKSQRSASTGVFGNCPSNNAAQACGAVGTLVVPCWLSAPFWPILCPDGKFFDDFIVGVVELPMIQHLFLPGLSGAALFDGQLPNTPVLALRCDFSFCM